MTKAWFRFSRSSRPLPPTPEDQSAQDAPAEEEAPTAPTDAAPPALPSEASAEPAAEPAAEVGEPAPEPEPAELAAAEQVEEPTDAAEPAEPAAESAAEAPEPIVTGAPTQAQRLALALGSGEGIPSYVDTQSAGDWLAMLSQISAVTAYKALSYDLLDLQPGERAVDVGCGIGYDARELARRVGPEGKVVGVDGSEDMIARAIEATDEATARTLSFLTGDATALPLESGAFDALRADRLLQHVDDPLQALIEFRRVLRPGARLVIIEPDWKTMAVYPGSAIGGDDDRCAAAIFDWQVAHTRHPLIGRQLRMLLTQAGFVSVSVTPVAYASTSFMEADLTLELTRAVTGAAEQWPTRLSAADAQAWRVTAQAADAAGHFFASAPLYFAHAIVE